MSVSPIVKADKVVIPVKTGIQKARLRQRWIPAYAGMTVQMISNQNPPSWNSLIIRNNLACSSLPDHVDVVQRIQKKSGILRHFHPYLFLSPDTDADNFPASAKGGATKPGTTPAVHAGSYNEA